MRTPLTVARATSKGVEASITGIESPIGESLQGVPRLPVSHRSPLLCVSARHRYCMAQVMAKLRTV